MKKKHECNAVAATGKGKARKCVRGGNAPCVAGEVCYVVRPVL